MTAAVTALSIAMLALVVGALILGGLYVALSKSHYELKAHNLALVLDHRGVASQNIEKATRIAKLERELAETQAQRDRYRTASLAGLPDDLVRDIVNGVPADKDSPSGSPDREPSGAAGAVSDL